MDESGPPSPYKQRGRPPKEEVKDRLVTILKEKRLGTTYRLRNIYREWYNESLSWNTVKKYLQILLEEERVVRQVSISHSNGDQVVVYRLRENSEER